MDVGIGPSGRRVSPGELLSAIRGHDVGDDGATGRLLADAGDLIEELLGAITTHWKARWNARAVLAPPDRALYDVAEIDYVRLAPWQGGDRT